MKGWQLGNISVQRVLEFEGPLLAPSEIFPASTEPAIENHRHWLEPNLLDPETGLLVIALHSFVVRTPRHVILVDTCSGNNRQRPKKPRYHMNQWPYLENLMAAGVHPGEVDFVLCTHLHVDHVGWNTQLRNGRWVPTFPNAKYLFGRQEWEFWKQHFSTTDYTDDPYFEDSILPVIKSGQAVFVESDYSLEDGIWLEPAPGHTPGQVCVHLSSGRREAVMSGDLMHHAVQCAEPDWSTIFCVDPDEARITRRAFLDRYAETNTLILPAHFPTPTSGRIVTGGNAWRFTFEEAAQIN